jgi:hypothetical protein
MKALERLERLARDFGMGGHFDGFSMLLMSVEKLRCWWIVSGLVRGRRVSQTS